MAEMVVAEHKVVAAAEATARALGAEEILSVIALAASELVGPPEARRIDDQEVLVAEFAVQVEGYYTQVPGVFHTGTATPEQREMYQVAHQGYMAGVQAARLGNTVGDIAKAELDALEEAGWLEWHEYDLGHGDGLDHPEVPAITPTSDMPVEAGMVLVGEEGTIPLHDVSPTL